MFRRAVAAAVWLTFAGQTVACYSTRRTEAEPSQLRESGEDRIVGITTLEGRSILFDQRWRAVVRNDTLYARVHRDPYVIALADVERVWLDHSEFDAVASIGATVGVLLGTTIVVGAIALATKESCPFVYSWDGSQYVFDAEPYGGAITRGMERDDFGELEHLQPTDGVYRIRLTNEVNETQYTNLMELWVVDHPIATRVETDEWGRLHTVQGRQPPKAAINRAGQNLLPWLAATDRRIWEPRPVPDASQSMREEIVLTFPKPRDANSVKLMANVATGLWGSHMIREMLELRGNQVKAFYASVDGDRSAYDSLLAWSLREDLYLLKVQVEEPTGWELRGVLPGGGPFIAEDRVIPLDISRVDGDELRLRVRPTRGFWALNSFAVDYGVDQAVQVDTIPPMRARDSYGRDVLPRLLEVDERYYDMPRTGDWAEVVFPAPPPVNGMARTVFLHSRGYYRLHLPESGDADTTLVREILEVPGAAAEFAASRYERSRATQAGLNNR